jgi:hypothetical protein
VGWNYLKGRLRSHPDVAERYYQDVFRERPGNRSFKDNNKGKHHENCRF